MTLTTIRGAEIKLNRGGIIRSKFGNAGLSFIAAPAVSYQGTLGLYNLLGNVAEWTSTSAEGNLFNNLEYIYTMSDKIIPKTLSKIDSNALQNYLHKPKYLPLYYVVKGGSWLDEIYYLQPAAEEFVYAFQKNARIGFRYVVRVYKK